MRPGKVDRFTLSQARPEFNRQEAKFFLPATFGILGCPRDSDIFQGGETELFERVQATLARNRRSGGTNVRTKNSALLKGLLRCANCDCAMAHTYTTKRQRRYRYYRCSGDQKRGSNTCPTGSIPTAEIERFVVDQIKCVGRDPLVIKDTLAQARSQAEDQR